MPETAARIIRRELDPDEELLWAGRPRQGIVLSRIDWFLIPFSVLWGGFAIVWEAIVLSMGVWPFAIFGAFFVAIGLYMMVGRFLMASRKRAHTYYGITSRRVIILSGKRLDQVQSKRLTTIDDLDLKVSRDGSGTVELAKAGSPWGMSGAMADAGWPMAGSKAPPRIALVDNARDVYQTIRRARGALESDATSAPRLEASADVAGVEL